MLSRDDTCQGSCFSRGGELGVVEYSRTCRNRHQVEGNNYVRGRRLGTHLKYIPTHPDEN